MVFSSPIFLFFFLPLALVVYFVAPVSWRNAVLLGASLFFYAWGEKFFVLLMIVAIGMNYGLGRWLEAACEPYRRRILCGGVALNLTLLIGFKYLNFAVANLNGMLGAAAVPTLNMKSVHLPIGISFFTFEAIAYLIDISRRQTPAARSPIQFGLFMTLFPHLIAGPVVRYRDLAAALANRTTTAAQFASGIRRFSIGLGKKMLLANTLGAVAIKLFALPPAELAASAAWLGALCYGLHIYFDFSGYSDMAIGLGRLFGFELCANFRYPYCASSITDFWRRWHMSLSTWFRDYLYIPLGGKHVGTARLYANLVLVFVLCGLWHGASWTFLAWGLWHGAFLVVERTACGRWLTRWPAPLRHTYTLLAVLGGWVLFAAPSLGHALGFGSALMGLTSGPHLAFDYLSRELWLALVLGIVCCMPVFPWLRARFATATRLAPVFELAKLAVPLGLILAATMHLAAGTYNPFVYFRF